MQKITKYTNTYKYQIQWHAIPNACNVCTCLCPWLVKMLVATVTKTSPRYVEACAYFLAKVGEIMMLNPLEVFNVLDPLSARHSIIDFLQAWCWSYRFSMIFKFSASHCCSYSMKPKRDQSCTQVWPALQDNCLKEQSSSFGSCCNAGRDCGVGRSISLSALAIGRSGHAHAWSQSYKSESLCSFDKFDLTIHSLDIILYPFTSMYYRWFYNVRICCNYIFIYLFIKNKKKRNIDMWYYVL